MKNTMSRIEFMLALLAITLLFSCTSKAQTTITTLPSGLSVTNILGQQSPTSPIGTLETVASWATTINTNYYFPDVLLWDGPVYQKGVNIANEVGGSWDLWRQNAGTNAGSTLFAGLELRARQGAVGSAFVSENFGGEFGWINHDFKVGVFADGVYRSDAALAAADGGRMAGEFGLFADKMLSPGSAAGVFVSIQTGDATPLVGANLNVTFGSVTGFLGYLGL
jgi:hypothetical protein